MDRISTHAFLFDGELTFYLKKIYFLENDLESPLIFVLFWKEQQNKIKKTLSVTLYLENMVCEKPNLESGLDYLLGRYGKDYCTPLSP